MIGSVPSRSVGMPASLRWVQPGADDRESTRPRRPPDRPSSSAAEGLQQEARRGLRVVQERQRAARAGPRDIGQPALLLERALRLRRIRDRPTPGEAVGEHDHVVPLEALGAVRRGERQRRVVAPELGQASAARRNRGPQRLEGGQRGRPAEHRPRQVDRRRAVRDVGRLRRVPAAADGFLAQRPAQASQREQRRTGPVARRLRPLDRAGRRCGRPRSAAAGRARGTGRRGRPRQRRRPGARGSCGRGSHAWSRQRARSRIARVTRTRSSAGVGREDEPAGRVGSGDDPLREALVVVLDEADRPLDDGPRAAVVRLEVDATQARQRRRRGRGPVARRRAASRRSSGRRRPPGTRRCPAPRAAARAPAGSGRGPAPRPPAAARSGRAR